MKGTAPADTLTGRIQREIADGWMSAFQVWRALDYTDTNKLKNVEACLERLVREGRAERQVFAAIFEYRGLSVSERRERETDPR